MINFDFAYAIMPSVYSSSLTNRRKEVLRQDVQVKNTFYSPDLSARCPESDEKSDLRKELDVRV